MQKKNYYEILGVAPGSSRAEIKAAYRRLALIYHPDKNAGDDIDRYVFQQINEAYQILYDNAARADYHRSFEAQGHRFSKEKTAFFSSDLLLVKLSSMRNAIAETDPYRMDTDALFEELQQLFSAYHLSILQQENNVALSPKIASNCLEILVFLPKRDQLLIMDDLKRLPGLSPDMLQDYIKKQQKKWFWDRYKMVFVLLLSVVLCVLLFQLMQA